MARGAGVGRHVPRGAEKDATEMHELAEREVGQQDAHEKNMHIENGCQAFRNGGVERNQPHGEFLGRNHVYLGHIAHEDAGKSDAEYQEKRKKISCKGNVFDVGD